jgi:hypothetical protein
MRRSPVSAAELRVFFEALPLFVRNPAIIVVPLLSLIVGVLIRQVMTPYGGGTIGSLTLGIAQLIAIIVALLGLGSACIMADEAWRRGRGSFDTAWSETQRRAGEILSAAIGFTLLLTVAQYIAVLIPGVLGIVILALAVYFLIWTVPAAAAGGVPGGAAIQISIERVRSAPLVSAIATVVTLILVFYLAPLAAGALTGALAGGLLFTSPIVTQLIGALLQSIAVGYVALVLTKLYTDIAFTRRSW